jgi:hypothetical protein
MSASVLPCGTCGSEIEPEDVDRQRGIVQCCRCQSVAPANASTEPSDQAAATPSLGEPSAVPEELRLLTDDTAIEIVQPWFSGLAIPLAVLCIIASVAVPALAVAAIVYGHWPAAILAVGLLAVVAGMTYATAALFVNQTTLRVDRDVVQVRHGPMPWPGNKYVATQRIEQILCRRYFMHSQDGMRTFYKVLAATGQAKPLVLLSRLLDPASALFVEEHLQRFVFADDR